MKLNHLRDVVAISERGSLRAAARHLGLAQPALTRSVHELERELGAPLFERNARGMTLTRAGEAFVRRAAVVLSEVRRAQEEVDQLHGGTGGRVVAGLSIASHVALLPHVLRPFRSRYPNVQLQIIEGLYPTLEVGLKDGSIDVYVGPQPPHSLPSELLGEKLFDNTRVIVGRTNHPLSGARRLGDLAEAEWATTSITHKGEEELGELFARYGLPPPRLALRSQSALTLMVSLAFTDLLAMLPVQFKDFELTAGTLAPISIAEVLPAPPIMLARRAGLPLTPAAEFFTDLVRRRIPRPIPGPAVGRALRGSPAGSRVR